MTEENNFLLGRFDLCLNVKNIQKSVDFYKKLGLKEVEGNIEEKWLVLSQGNLRLALYEGHISETMLNFRGGDVFKISKNLLERGITFEKNPELFKDGSEGATLRDPDGNVIFLNTYPSEKDVLSRLKVEF